MKKLCKPLSLLLLLALSLSLLTGRSYDPVKELELFMRILADCAEKTNTAEGRRYLDECFKEYVFNLPS